MKGVPAGNSPPSSAWIFGSSPLRAPCTSKPDSGRPDQSGGGAGAGFSGWTAVTSGSCAQARAVVAMATPTAMTAAAATVTRAGGRGWAGPVGKGGAISSPSYREIPAQFEAAVRGQGLGDALLG